MGKGGSIDESGCFDHADLGTQFTQSRSRWPILIGSKNVELLMSNRSLVVVLAINGADELICLRSMGRPERKREFYFPTGQMACHETIHQAAPRTLMQQLGVQAAHYEMLGEAMLGTPEQAVRAQIIVATGAKRVAAPLLSYASKLELALLPLSSTAPEAAASQFCTELHTFAAAMISVQQKLLFRADPKVSLPTWAHRT